MHREILAGAALAAVLMGASSNAARAEEFSAALSGYNEVGSLNAETGAINSTGQGTLKLTLDENAKTLSYTLSYSGLASVQQSHIHFGKVHSAGGIVVFFCSNLGNGPAGTPACPASAGTVSGTVTAAGVVALAAQNIAAGDFTAVEGALKSNTAYANVHTLAFPKGEIRGQIHRARHEDD